MIFTFLTRMAARHLSRHRVATERARIKAKARQLRKELGLPGMGELR